MEKNIHLETYIYEHTYTHIYLHIYIYLYASYFHLGNKITFNFGLFFENVQIRTKLLKKVSRALKITEKKITMSLHQLVMIQQFWSLLLKI